MKKREYEFDYLRSSNLNEYHKKMASYIRRQVKRLYSDSWESQNDICLTDAQTKVIFEMVSKKFCICGYEVERQIRGLNDGKHGVYFCGNMGLSNLSVKKSLKMKSKSRKQIDSLFRRRLEAYQKQRDKETANCNNIPFGYGMRAYHRFKTMSFRSDEIADKLKEMASEHSIDPGLLREAV